MCEAVIERVCGWDAAYGFSAWTRLTMHADRVVLALSPAHTRGRWVKLAFGLAFMLLAGSKWTVGAAGDPRFNGVTLLLAACGLLLAVSAVRSILAWRGRSPIILTFRDDDGAAGGDSAPVLPSRLVHRLAVIHQPARGRYRPRLVRLYAFVGPQRRRLLLDQNYWSARRRRAVLDRARQLGRRWAVPVRCSPAVARWAMAQARG